MVCTCPLELTIMKMALILFLTFFITLANASEDSNPKPTTQQESVIVEAEIPANEYAEDSLPLATSTILWCALPLSSWSDQPKLANLELMEEVFKPPRPHCFLS